MPKFPFKSALSLLSAALLSACSLVKYQPVAGIDTVDLQRGYRFETSQLQRNNEDDTLIVLMFSGGGTRAAALGYGVLEQLNKQQVTIGGKRKSLLANVDVVVGVSGGSVLAAYFALKGEETIPLFYKRFLHQNFQRQVVKQAFSMSNLPRLASPEYGRGDLLQEQFENYLFGKTTFRDLEKNAKGPFAIISATDMGIGERFNFTQEYFDPMCIDLGDLRLARAVAASSSVPMVFAPITLNNNGGRCSYTVRSRRICHSFAEILTLLKISAVPNKLQFRNENKSDATVAFYFTNYIRSILHWFYQFYFFRPYKPIQVE